jgi:hypothetical protein
MEALTLKVVLTPTLIVAASLAGRRWGPAVSGWLIGLPFTSGPIAFFLALAHGTTFAATSAVGTLAGTLSQVAFCLIYAGLAARVRWPLTIVAASLAFAVGTIALHSVTLSVPLLVVSIVFSLVIALRLLPPPRRRSLARTPPSWDLPARMVIATTFVVLLTGLAPALGAQLTGLLAPFPLYGTILMVFAHAQRGPAAAQGVVRGLLFGLFAFAGFFLMVAVLLPVAGIALSFAAALAVAVLIQAGTLRILRRGAV